MNIFSHLGGALLFFNLPFGMTVLGAIYPNMPLWDMIAIGVFLYGVGICFALSAAFHTFSSHSYSGYHLSRQLDFQGIIILVMATSSPQVYYTFYNEPSLRKLYWSVVSRSRKKKLGDRSANGILRSSHSASLLASSPSRHFSNLPQGVHSGWPSLQVSDWQRLRQSSMG